MVKSNADVQLALSEMRFAMEQSLAAGDSLDRKASTIIAAAALLLPIGTVLQVSVSPERSDLYWGISILALLLFIAGGAAALFIGRPQDYHLPIAADWDELDRQILGRPEREALLAVLAGYVDQVPHNERLNRRKARLYGYSIAVLAASALLILLLPTIS